MYNIITFLSVNMWNEKKPTIIKNDIIILCTKEKSWPMKSEKQEDNFPHILTHLDLCTGNHP